ncbi:MAG: type II toxin-antitoxin system VapB family antitoxin [Deltaproteobacteria bacterium]|nr:type II toxin-antitoxin system VapB family antitoxin [Deltaproteobacteria bacterium]
MKTTIELSEKLLRSAKKYAAARGLSLKSVVESALRTLLESNRRPVKFSLKDGSVTGKGMSNEFADAAWEKIRAEIYKGRGA